MRLPQRGISKYIIPKVGRELAFVVFWRTYRENPQTQIHRYNLREKEPNSYCQCLLLLIHKDQRTLLYPIP